MKVCAETFDLAEMAREVAATVQGLVEKKGNTLELRMAPCGLGTMHSDVTKIRQVLLNLLSNAAKFTENGTITAKDMTEEDRRRLQGVDRVLSKGDTSLRDLADELRALMPVPTGPADANA